ncbi:hypothetical protein [Rariglobus hedericola]|uniref:Uncharacterized protein n=1 Tax=Rariglobus hedericola TaxID=2597822 RepID=A0A556QLK2_9BACT|nr:hypothetical protein [Rariglobus hedericola]TSJ77507.1 hypothetical protein FPL22_15585 [Rariglobus hedericola]
MPKTKAPATTSNKYVFALLIDTVCQGPMPSWYDENGDPVIYSTRRKAQEEIADTQMEYWRQFMALERPFEDAANIDDYIVKVRRLADRTIQTKDGRIFGKQH